MWRILVAALWMFVALSSAEADEIKLPGTMHIGGVVYTHVVYVGHDAAYLTFQHDSGVGRVPIAYLPGQLRNELGYDARAAEKMPEPEKAEAAIPPPAAIIHGRLILNTEKAFSSP